MSSIWVIALLVLALLAAGCTSSPSGQGPSGTQGHQALPSDCTHTITAADEVSTVLAAAAPGDTVCFAGSDLTDTEVTMIKSGTAAAPIRLVADALVTVRSVEISADHVSLEGFTVVGGDGVLLRGAGITARNNTVHDTHKGGITCRPCTDSTIESNTLTHNTTDGIDITGQRIIVHANTISDAVPQGDGDTDGIRFYGNGHRITDNTIRDLSAEGYANAPHPDCFQTWDNNAPATFDVVISGTTCHHADSQCLIATGDQNANSGAPTATPSITFVDNTCVVGGAQAINLRRWPNVEIRHNTLSGPNLTRGILIVDGSTGAIVTGNTTTGHPSVEVDDSSRPGSHVDANRPA